MPDENEYEHIFLDTNTTTEANEEEGVDEDDGC
jgi:hypothetical protein